MRIIRVDEDESDGNTLLWIAAGATIGLAAGALMAERMGGRPLTVRSLWRRSRGLAELAVEQWQPLVAAALAVRDAWDGRDGGYEVKAGEDEDGEDGTPLDNSARADSELDDSELDDSELDDSELDDNARDDSTLDDGEFPDDGLDARVLEAFSNDPILAERAVEIEEAEGGRILLHGRVHAASEVAHAVTLARGVPGVTAVRQRLRVRDRR